jgi:hypothetical protein
MARKKSAGRGIYVLGRAGIACRSQHADYFRCWRARSHRVDSSVAYPSVRLNDKDRGLGDAAPLLRVVEIPLANDAPLRIAQNRERQTQPASQGLRLFKRIYGDGHNARPGCADSLVMVAIVRQLAEAEGSPVAAIK